MQIIVGALRRVGVGLCAMTLLGILALGNVGSVWAAAVCSDTPGVGDWILCEENDDSLLQIDARGVTIETTSSNTHGVRSRHTGTGNSAIVVRTAPDPQNPGLVKLSTITTGGNNAHGIYGHRSGGSGLVQINVNKAKITTTGLQADGVNGLFQGDGIFRTTVRDSSIVAQGQRSASIFGRHFKSGHIQINVRNTKIETRSTAVDSDGRTTAHGIWGWISRPEGTGNIDINVLGGLFETAGTVSHSIVGQHPGTGDVEMDILLDASVVTEGRQAYGILGWQQQNGSVDLNIRGTTVNTKSTQVGTNGRTSAHGIFGVVQNPANTGDLAIKVQDSSIETAGIASNGVYGLN